MPVARGILTAVTRLRLLHVIHDFLPRHAAGSEIYTFELCRELARRHHVTVLCADFDPSRPHGHVTWRTHQGLPVVEIVNNWVARTFEATYRPALINEQIEHVLHAVQPDVVHVHNLLNLSFDLPAMARAGGSRVVATLHDYTLVCASGGQRLHVAERHVCHTIDTERCARCFRESTYQVQASVGTLTASLPGRLQRLASSAGRRFPQLSRRVAAGAASVSALAVTPQDLDARLAAAREVFDGIDLFVAPSPSIAAEFTRFGVDPGRIKVSDYGSAAIAAEGTVARDGPLRIGYVGTLVWHKGVHVLLDAVRRLPPEKYQLRIFGDAEMFPEYVSRLREQAAGLPVTFAGRFDRERLAEVYRQIDVLVVPSLWLENSPLVIHEAFMAGVPVVAARSGGIADLLAHGRNGWLYEPTSPGDLAAALQEVIERPERLDEFRRSLPPVKSIAQDAAEWEAAYEAVCQA